MPQENIELKINDPEERKRKFFAEFARKHLSAFKLHKQFGLLPKSEGWSNVSRHQLMQGATMDILGPALGLPDEDVEKMVQAALIHDFYKRKEIDLMQNEGVSADTLMKAEKQSEEILLEQGIDPEIVRLTDSVGLTKINRMRDPDVTLPEKIMFYIDNITDNDNIVNLKERIDALPSRYPDIAKTGIYPVLLVTAQNIETELAGRIGLENPAQLPEYIRKRIWEKIDSQ